MLMLDQPLPHAMSATCADGGVDSRAWMSARAGSQCEPSCWAYMGRLVAATPSRVSSP